MCGRQWTVHRSPRESRSSLLLHVLVSLALSGLGRSHLRQTRLYPGCRQQGLRRHHASHPRAHRFTTWGAHSTRSSEWPIRRVAQRRSRTDERSHRRDPPCCGTVAILGQPTVEGRRRVPSPTHRPVASVRPLEDRGCRQGTSRVTTCHRCSHPADQQASLTSGRFTRCVVATRTAGRRAGRVGPRGRESRGCRPVLGGRVSRIRGRRRSRTLRPRG